MAKIDVIVFNGIRFARYPESSSLGLRNYYHPKRGDAQRGVKRLHQEIWIAAHGPIPDGYEIHHINGNYLDNRIENLEALSPSEHQRKHSSDPRRKIHLDSIRHKAAEWHRSKEGREWHSKTSKRAWKIRKPLSHKCKCCGAEYLSRSTDETLFCSKNCKAKDRRDSGIDNETRVCVMCGRQFVTNKYHKKEACSVSCGGKLATIRRLQGR